MPHAIERLFATPKTIPRMPRMTPVVTPAERVCSIKASLVLAGDSYAHAGAGFSLAVDAWEGEGSPQPSQNV
jgi:hypothetical protein